MDKFLPHRDPLANHINQKAEELHGKLQQLNVDKLGMPYHCLHYFKGSHSTRLFFSIETSAHILYRSLKTVDKDISSVVFLDYGAGVGTLFLLAKLIGCKQVIYNDHLEDWKTSAQLIAEAVDIHIDHYVVGDTKDCLDYLVDHNLQCDIIASRNVIEHIYKLDEFFSAVHTAQPQALIFSSTTANMKNPASVAKHRVWHKKWEKEYLASRMKIISEKLPEATSSSRMKLAIATRGLGSSDLDEAIESFRKDGTIPDPSIHRSNTCEPISGVWAEHMLTHSEYLALINDRKFEIQFAPGFWDTHYSKRWKNIASGTLNAVMRLGKMMGFALAPFIYVIAKPKKPL